MARAMRIFREFARARPSVLRLVLDSLAGAAPVPALRARAARTRFLRFEGEVTVEVEVSVARRGLDVRGQVTPRGDAAEVRLRGRRVRRAAVAADGTFVVRGVSPGPVVLEVGRLRTEGLVL
jgi:hypothetical protein